MFTIHSDVKSQVDELSKTGIELQRKFRIFSSRMSDVDSQLSIYFEPQLIEYGLLTAD